MQCFKNIFYSIKNCQHVGNELLYVLKKWGVLLNRAIQGVAHEGLKKMAQFAIIVNLFWKRKLMIEYDSIGVLKFF